MADLKDSKAKLIVLARLAAAEQGHFVRCALVGEGLSEVRIRYGPGYRLYFTRIGATVYFLLIGGDKSTQRRDIRRAVDMARQIGKE